MEEERCKNYELIMQVERLDLVSNRTPFDCPICMQRHEVGDGVTLRECLHTFCRCELSALLKARRRTETRQLYLVTRSFTNVPEFLSGR